MHDATILAMRLSPDHEDYDEATLKLRVIETLRAARLAMDKLSEFLEARQQKAPDA